MQTCTSPIKHVYHVATLQCVQCRYLVWAFSLSLLPLDAPDIKWPVALAFFQDYQLPPTEWYSYNVIANWQHLTSSFASPSLKSGLSSWLLDMSSSSMPPCNSSILCSKSVKQQDHEESPSWKFRAKESHSNDEHAHLHTPTLKWWAWSLFWEFKGQQHRRGFASCQHINMWLPVRSHFNRKLGGVNCYIKGDQRK